MKIKAVYLALALVLLFSLAAVISPIGRVSAQTTWYVDDDNCPGPGTGTLVDPFCSIQNAIGNASADDTIIIAAGTYNEHDITINKSLTIQGAGAGSTFVDGQDISRVFYINNSVVDMSGMTVGNGNVSVSANGGGIYNNGGNMTMTNCTISGNDAQNGGGLYNNGGNVTMTNCTISGNEAYFGGGIYRDGGEVTLTNCTVSGNTAGSGQDGGGIHNNGGTGDGLTMTGCTISDNKAENGDGGGIRNYGPLEMTNCTISGNYALYSGGGIHNSGNVTMTGCTVSGNTANVSGGGIYNNNVVIMTSCTVSGNEADDGGGIYNYGGQVTMTDCTVNVNTARDGNGGGIGTVLPDDTLTMTNCTISGNNASGDGGGIYNDHDEVTLTNCTVSVNTAGGDGGGIRNEGGGVDMTNCTVSGNNAYNGGGIHTHLGLITLTNCTVSNNSAQNWGGGVYNVGTGLPEYVELRCTIIYGNADADIDTCYDNYYGEYIDIGDESIVDECLGSTLNPLLGPLQNNGGPTKTHALMIGSPAIDACIVSCNLTTDQRGRPRPVDGDLDYYAFCDVGAYEKLPAVGGIVEPVDRIGILAPWLGLAALMAVALSVLVVAKRRRVA